MLKNKKPEKTEINKLEKTHKKKLNDYLDNNSKKITILREEVGSLESKFEEKLDKVRNTWKKKYEKVLKERNHYKELSTEIELLEMKNTELQRDKNDIKKVAKDLKMQLKNESEK